MTPAIFTQLRANPALALLMAIVLGIALVLALTSVLFVLRQARRALLLGVLTAALGLTLMALGYLGSASGRSSTESAARSPGLTPRDRARVTAEGYDEAGAFTTAGVTAGALPLALGLLTAALALRARRSR